MLLSSPDQSQRLRACLENIFVAVSGGGVIADGTKLEQEMLRHRGFRRVLKKARRSFEIGQVPRLREEEFFLRREFLEVRTASSTS